MSGVEKRKNFIIHTVYIATVLALFYLFFKYAFGVLFPFLCALALAAAFQRPVNFICRKTPIKRGPASVFMVLVGAFVILAAFVLVFIRLGVELRGFFQYLMIQLEDIPQFIAKIENYIAHGLSFLPDKLEKTVTSFFSEKLAILLNAPNKPEGGSLGLDFSMLSTPLLGVWNTAKQIPTTLISIVMAAVACCFMTADFVNVKRIILSLFPSEPREKLIRAKRLLVPALGKMGKAYGLIIIITFCELSLGLFLLKLIGVYQGGYILIISLITALIDIVPILGTGTVLVPWALFCLLNGNFGLAIGIFVVYACITVIRQIIEPKLVASQLGIPPFATIIAMYLGTRLFGFIGLFLLPITLVMIKLLNDEGIIKVFHFESEKKKENAETGKESEITDGQ